MAKDSKNRFVSPRAWERIEQWSRRKPVFALMGEFSAGKSTLMNFLLRKQALPTQVTATQLPPVWFSWGSPSAYVKRHDGSTEGIELDQLDQVGVNEAQFIRIFLEADILEAVDLIDTPGISDPKISTDVWQRAVGQANGVLWCTHATQAWRETERATWVSLPERLQNNSLLLITRADALGVKDRQKVLRRVNREAGHLFNRSILFSARDAIQARDKTGDAEQWARSGGGKMVDSFLEITEQIMDARADQLSRYQIDKSLSGEPGVQPLRPARKSDDAQPDKSAPLKLVNPVDAGATDAGQDNEVVTSFPVRPSRVERRVEETDRERIDADEAERLRAEMVPENDIADEAPEGAEDDLRAFFRDTSSDPLDITALSGSSTNTDDLDLLDEDDADLDEEDELTATAEETSDAPSQSADDGDDPEALLASLNDKLADTAELETPMNDPAEEPPAAGIDVSVSSITALVAEQAESSEPDAAAPALPDRAGPALEELLNVPAGSPLSASAMWREIADGEDLPDDAQGLRNVFQAFLQEFDQIAVEHSARQSKESLRPVPKANESGGAEWHVL